MPIELGLGYVYVLSKESEETIERFGEGKDDALKLALATFAARFYANESPAESEAREDFLQAWKALKGDPRWQNAAGEFESCLIEPQEVPALKGDIKDSDDFVFYLENDNDGRAEALLRSGLRDDKAARARGPGWSVEGQLPAGAAGADDVEFKATVSAVEQAAGSSRFSFDQEMWLWDEGRGRAAKGRVLACLCDRGERWSVSFRRTEKKVRQGPRPGAGPEYLNKPWTIGKLVYQTIFELEDSEQHGLVVIAGRTGSCKSQIAKGLVETYLGGRPDRHLVTYEDPIERKFKTRGFNTSREKGKDVADLHEATRNALRQKPAALFVGETRDPEEWKLLLHYAGTGHLVVTTAHAGSLIEAMGNILQATEANDPTTRSVVGERLLAVVHLKSEKAGACAGGKLGILVPALWRRTSEGIKALMSEGLSSLQPNTPPERTQDQELPKPFPSSVGRYWFARELLKEEGALKKLSDNAEVENSALEWDLQGV
ncbi:MAG TPA: ATPase, T2SS/T4P/T4SS family [Pyrinomonadaceae bacterium]|nr:ATPase, T2SS/T4P/T4SS family [Pyrinomonadaceae bacterium]